MKIILVGYMGSGKTTLGKRLSSAFQLPFIDLDHYIEQKENASVSEIFTKKGEIFFRKKEILYLEELLKSDQKFVLALGGGTPCYGENMKHILESSNFVFYLKYQPKSLTDRLLHEKKNRPLIAHLSNEDLEDFIRKHLFDRNPYYMQSHHIVTMDGLSADESFEKIKTQIEKYCHIS